MTQHKHTMVGAPDPELKTSPIVEDINEDNAVLAQEVEDLPYCLFNNVSFDDGEYVCSGSGALLHCEKGLWGSMGGCDPDNP